VAAVVEVMLQILALGELVAVAMAAHLRAQVLWVAMQPLILAAAAVVDKAALLQPQHLPQAEAGALEL
jgi:hypothetical protein